MRTLDVDNEVYALIDGRAVASATSHNRALRQLLGMSSRAARASSRRGAVTRAVATGSPIPRPPLRKPAQGGKAPWANLAELEFSGFIQDGERLLLIDHRGQPVPGYEATVSGNQLMWRGETFSMSQLAKQGLQALGFTSKSVRGPAHWVQDQARGGESIAHMWARVRLAMTRETASSDSAR